MLDVLGEVFAVFDRQDSVSYGIRAGATRSFVKTAGRADDPAHARRVALLRNAIELARVAHPALSPLRQVIEAPDGPLLVYDWFDGELLGVPRAERADPASAFQRFRSLPKERIAAALDAVFDLHVVLAAAGWIAGDFYDGCLMYDFAASQIRVIDLDHYHRGPSTNTTGRLVGSSRFMAPEELALGAVIDERTTVFNLGRAIAVFLDEELPRACDPDPARRFATVAEFAAAFSASRLRDRSSTAR